MLTTANKPETALYRAPTFSLLLASHGGISSRTKPAMQQGEDKKWELCTALFPAYKLRT